MLRARVRGLDSVTALFGWSATDVQLGDDGVHVTAVEESTGARREIEGSYVVGCDGARFDGQGTGRHSVAVERISSSAWCWRFSSRAIWTRTWNAFPRGPRTACCIQSSRDTGGSSAASTPATLVLPRTGAPRTRQRRISMSIPLIERAAGSPTACDLPARWILGFARRHRRYLPPGPGLHRRGCGAQPSALWRVRAEYGARDAVNLGWKLAAVLNNWGSPGLLDSYTQERRPIFVETAGADHPGNRA